MAVKAASSGDVLLRLVSAAAWPLADDGASLMTTTAASLGALSLRRWLRRVAAWTALRIVVVEKLAMGECQTVDDVLLSFSSVRKVGQQLARLSTDMCLVGLYSLRRSGEFPNGPSSDGFTPIRVPSGLDHSGSARQRTN